MRPQYEQLLATVQSCEAEIAHLNNELEALNAARNSMPVDSYQNELNNINNHIERQRQIIANTNETIRIYNSARNAIDRLPQLQNLLDHERDMQTRSEIQEEIRALRGELRQNMERLSPELTEELRSVEILEQENSNNEQNGPSENSVPEENNNPEPEPENENMNLNPSAESENPVSLEDDLEPEEIESLNTPEPEINTPDNINVERVRRQIDERTSGNFVERSNNIVRNSTKTVEKLAAMAEEYNAIPMRWASRKTEIVREKERVVTATMEERKARMDSICDDLEEQIQAIENNPSLTEEQKEEEKAKKYAELDEQINLIEEYPNLSTKEQDKKLDEELESIDNAILADQRQLKKQMAHVMTMQILLLGRYLRKGYDPKEVYEALAVLAEIELDDKELEKFLRNTFHETLLRNPEIQRIYIAFSEKKAFEDEQNQSIENNIKNGVDAIEELLNKAEKNLDRDALNKACDMISKLPNSDDKNDLQARAAEIDKLIRENKKEENKGPGDGNPSSGGNSSGDGAPSDDDPPRPEEDEPTPEIPQIIENAPKKTWKTWLALAAGIGVGAAVFFTCGTVGVSVMAIAGGIAKRLITKRRKKLEMQRLNGEIPVESAEEPEPGIKGKIEQLKKYFKSEEFCRDATWFLNGAIYTGLGLNVASSIYNLASAKFGTPTPDPTPTPKPSPTPDPVSTPKPTDLADGIRIGDNVGGYNVSVGHDTAAWSIDGTHTENLISEYVNSNSIFKRFAVMNPDGTVNQMINTNGLTLSDFCEQSGIDINQISVDVANKDGASQAWISFKELTKDVGGRSL